MEYCEKENYRGYDPYDGLNSKFFQALPLLNRNKYLRLAWIQAFKRSPVNLRSILGVKKEENPKALGLFLSGYCALYKLSPSKEYYNKIESLVNKIYTYITPGWKGACWGYNFDWQARAFFQPKFTPTVVTSTFVANALLDAHEIFAALLLL